MYLGYATIYVLYVLIEIYLLKQIYQRFDRMKFNKPFEQFEMSKFEDAKKFLVDILQKAKNSVIFFFYYFDEKKESDHKA